VRVVGNLGWNRTEVQLCDVNPMGTRSTNDAPCRPPSRIPSCKYASSVTGVLLPAPAHGPACVRSDQRR
jgi:hypothetical protein